MIIDLIAGYAVKPGSEGNIPPAVLFDLREGLEKGDGCYVKRKLYVDRAF